MTLVRPAYLGAPNSALVEKLAAGVGSAQPPRISLKDDRFTLIQANGEPHPQVRPSLTLDVIIVGSNNGPSRIFYAGPYDPSASAAPACFSDNGVGPSVDAASPQGETCAVCPRAVRDVVSKMSGVMVSACSTHKKVAVLVAGAGDTVYLLSIPPGSLKPWRGYIAHLAGQGAAADEVITRLSMVEKTLGFDPVDFIPEAAISLVKQVEAGADPDIVTGNKDRPKVLTLAAPEQRPLISTQPENRVEPEAKQTQPRPASTTISHSEPPPPTREELEAELARLRAARSAPKETKPRGRPKQETVVGAGPIPSATFGAPPAEVKPNGGGFIGGGFGIQNAPPPDAAVSDALMKAFGTPTR